MAPRREGQRRGRALMDAAERWAAARGDRVITLNVFDANRRARGVYARLGYLPETMHYRKALAPATRHGAAATAGAAPRSLAIRPDEPDDADALWAILHAVIAAGDTYAFAPDMSPRRRAGGVASARRPHRSWPSATVVSWARTC